MSGASISYPHQHETDPRSVNIAMATCYPAYELSPPQRTVQVPVQKDYSRPLHVDCSVEYELPNTAKPPQGVRNEPLLMIHPCYFRKIESQRRSPFVNNLPTRQPQPATAAKRRTARGHHQPQPQQAAQYPVQYATDRQQLWDQMPNLVPISQAYCKRTSWCPPAAPAAAPAAIPATGRTRTAARTGPRTSTSFPASTIQQVCYNV
ncbi:hypothetical protein MTP99_001204 [Tenebrio molitor]|nr:hypothetical protein MTP99_001204 [Tenebrio molitor]